MFFRETVKFFTLLAIAAFFIYALPTFDVQAESQPKTSGSETVRRNPTASLDENSSRIFPGSVIKSALKNTAVSEMNTDAANYPFNRTSDTAQFKAGIKSDLIQPLSSPVNSIILTATAQATEIGRTDMLISSLLGRNYNSANRARH